MIALLLLTVLLMAFAVVSTSEPTIAANHVRAARARALAEAGVEHARRALASRIPDPLPAAGAGAPYDGRTFFPLGPDGGFEVAVTAGAVPTERAIQALGHAPRPSPGGINGSRRQLVLTVHRLPWLDPPAPLTAGGDVVIAGDVIIDARSDAGCGPKAGVHAAGTVAAGGVVYGHGDDVDSGGPPDRVSVARSLAAGLGFGQTDLATVRAIAQCCGVYLAGDQTFDRSHRLPGTGLVFVDTPDGATLSCAGPAPADGCGPLVRVLGDAAPPGESRFTGWLIVNGALEWSAETPVRGLLYAHDTVTLAGPGAVDGAVVSRNVSGRPSRIEGTSLAWQCQAARTGAGTVPLAWLPKAGTFREVPD
jgi:hypothetical protein